LKERITVTLDKELLKWIDGRIGLKIFANRSHAFEFLIKQEELKVLKEGKSGKDNKEGGRK
jgi:metal-responsive CopG/Arc/MetJ family transcriptional regulator